MNTSDILQWLSTFVIAAFLAYLAFKKAPAERNSLNGTASKSYAEAANITMEMYRKSSEEVKCLEARLELLEKKSYRITIEFTIGEPPTVGVVKIEPYIPEDVVNKRRQIIR
jgi:hypothetical protein